MTDDIAEFLQRHRLTQTTGIVAVSGGPDSVALAHACVGLLQAGMITRLVLAHLNHQLRGDESDGDESFVQGLPACWNADVTCRTTRIDMAAIAEAERDNLESTARRERYRWLTQVAHEEKAAWIATGHTADDQAETVLFRLLRGSGLLGLGGMTECRIHQGVKLVRPLLGMRRQRVLDYLSEKQIAYRIDSSNCDLRFTRNRLRLVLLPTLQEHYNSAIIDLLRRLGEQARELHAEVAADAGRLLLEAELPRAGDMIVLSSARLRLAYTNRLCEMFRLIWQREGWPMADMDYERWRRLVAIAVGAHAACDFPGAIHVRRAGNVVQIQRRSACV